MNGVSTKVPIEVVVGLKQCDRNSLARQKQRQYGSARSGANYAAGCLDGVDNLDLVLDLVRNLSFQHGAVGYDRNRILKRTVQAPPIRRSGRRTLSPLQALKPLNCNNPLKLNHLAGGRGPVPAAKLSGLKLEAGTGSTFLTCEVVRVERSWLSGAIFPR